MFESVDVKSLLIGGLPALLTATCFGGAPWLEQDTFHRFKMPTIDRGAFILDTATGQAWAHVTPIDAIAISPQFFEPKVDPNVYVPVP